MKMSLFKRMLRSGCRSFGRKYDYDVSYMLHVIDQSTAAGLRLALMPTVTQYKGPQAAREVWAGALLASTLDGDCGPCAQLVVAFALEEEVDPERLRAAIEGRNEAAGDVGLGMSFARHVLSGSYDPNPHLEVIRSRYGEQAVIAASFATATGRLYPVLKRGLGTGHACQQIEINGQVTRVVATV